MHRVGLGYGPFEASTKDAKLPAMNHRSTINGKVLGAEESGRKGLGGASNLLIVG